MTKSMTSRLTGTKCPSITTIRTRWLYTGLLLLTAFLLWTWLIQVIDVRAAGESGTDIGFATWNIWFHDLTGVHMTLYTITDWLGLVPIFVCLLFALVGLGQWIHRKCLWKVDSDILLLGVYYCLVIGCYLAFEMIPINYRPILIQGQQEASYPSSTTLLVLSVMPTLIFQARLRYQRPLIHRMITVATIGFSAFMVIGRLISGVHWITDIVGSLLLSGGLFCLYLAAVHWCGHDKDHIHKNS